MTTQPTTKMTWSVGTTYTVNQSELDLLQRNYTTAVGTDGSWTLLCGGQQWLTRRIKNNEYKLTRTK
jgi:hypothetical protein